MVPTKPNLVWATLDSVRTDHLSIYNYHRKTTPELERIAEDGTVFTNCFSHGTGTASSVASIFTGVWPSKHQVGMGSSVGRIPNQLKTAAEIFGEHGYHTICITTNPRIQLIGGGSGFDEYHDVNPFSLLKPKNLPITARFLKNMWSDSTGFSFNYVHHSFGFIVNEIARRRIESIDKPYFLYLHHNEPHRPYYPPLPYRDWFLQNTGITVQEALNMSTQIHQSSEEYNAGIFDLNDRDWEAINSIYDAAIAYADTLIGRLYDTLQSSNPLFAITADHGELLGEGGMFSHGQGVVRDELCHVPLLTVGLPGLTIHKDDVIQHNDVMRTFLGVAGVTDDLFVGYDLRENTRREYAVIQEHSDGYTTFEEYNEDFNRGLRKLGRIDGLRTKKHKLVTSQDGVELYKLPDESTDVSTKEANVCEELLKLHQKWNKEHGEPIVDRRAQDNYDKLMKKRLKDLGYI